MSNHLSPFWQLLVSPYNHIIYLSAHISLQSWLGHFSVIIYHFNELWTGTMKAIFFSAAAWLAILLAGRKYPG